MLLLAIDTAGPACAVAVARASGSRTELLATIVERIERGHAERLMPMIEDVIADAQVTFAELNRVAVTIGPGSFTGVRVGVAAARGLALALDIPAVGVGSLEALALPVARAHAKGAVLAALDARRGDVYARVQNLQSGSVLIEAKSIPTDELDAELRDLPGPLVLTGAGAPIVAAAIGAPQSSIVATEDCPDIADVAALGFHADASAPPTPLYARRVDAKPQADKALARR